MTAQTKDWATSRLVDGLSVSDDEARRLVVEVSWFLRAAAGSPGPLTPSKVVDRAWHALQEEPDAYATFSREESGALVHDVAGLGTPGRYADAKAALARLRGPLPTEFWPEAAAAAADCGSRGGDKVVEDDDDD